MWLRLAATAALALARCDVGSVQAQALDPVLVSSTLLTLLVLPALYRCVQHVGSERRADDVLA